MLNYLQRCSGYKRFGTRFMWFLSRWSFLIKLLIKGSFLIKMSMEQNVKSVNKSWDLQFIHIRITKLKIKLVWFVNEKSCWLAFFTLFSRNTSHDQVYLSLLRNLSLYWLASKFLGLADLLVVKKSINTLFVFLQISLKISRCFKRRLLCTVRLWSLWSSLVKRQ